MELEVLCLDFFWCDVLFQFLDLVVQDEFEFFKLLRFLLEMVNLGLSVSNCFIFFLNLLRQLVDFGSVLQDDGFLFFNQVVEFPALIFFFFVFLDNVLQSILHKLIFSLALEGHIPHLVHVLRVFVGDVLQLLCAVLLYLLHRQLVSVDGLVDIFLLLVDLGLLVFHFFAVLLLFEAHIRLVLLHNFRESPFKVLPLLLFLGLELLEPLCVVEHFGCVLLSLLFDDILLCVEEPSSLIFFAVLGLLDLPFEGLLFVLGVELVRFHLLIKSVDFVKLLLDVELLLNAIVVLLLQTLQLLFQLLSIIVELVHL